MSEERIKDMIEPIPNWEATYRYDGSRTCGKSYIQSLLDEKQQEIDRLNNIINKLEEYLYKIDEDYERDNGYRVRETKAYLKQLKEE